MSDKKTLPDKCAVARDLMPLCIDGTASDASQRRVNKHVGDCPPCAVVYQEMQTAIDLDVPDQQEAAQFETAVKKVKHKHAWRKLRNVLLGVVLALMVCAAGAYGYYWYFVEEVPLPVALYDMELSLRSPISELTPVFIRTKNMPQDAKLHVEVVAEGSSMDDNKQLQPNWVMYIWATTTRSVDLDTCSYTDYNYYAFDKGDNEGSLFILNESYQVDTIYKGAPSGEKTLLYRTGLSDYKLKYTAVRNLVLHGVASLRVQEPTVPQTYVTPMPFLQEDSTSVVVYSTPDPVRYRIIQVTSTPMQAQPTAAPPNGN